MSGDAFLSWANFLKDNLTGVQGLSVMLWSNQSESRVSPYLLVQDGPTNIKGGWTAANMCQGDIYISTDGTGEELAVIMRRCLDAVVDITKNCGSLPRWDYSPNPKVQDGLFIPKIFDISGALPVGSDVNRARRAITWQLFSSLL